MAHTPLYQKILDEAAQQRAALPHGHVLSPVGGSYKPTRGAATGIVGNLSNAPVVPGPLELREASLAELAAHVDRDLAQRGKLAPFGAVPYLEAMRALDCVSLEGSVYYSDSAASVVRYFLVNARTWTGPVARVVKAELNRRLGQR
jgi:hypothetical protein